MLRTTVICLVCTVTSGCFSFGGAYPASWEELAAVEPGTCPVIDGDYANGGDMFHETGANNYAHEPVGLVDILTSWGDDDALKVDFGPYDPTEGEETAVRLRLSGSTLLVTAPLADGRTGTLRMRISPDCRDSMLLLEPDWDATTNLIASGVERNSLALGRAIDGSLLLRSRSNGSLWVLYMPIVAGTDERWFRFPVAASEPPPVTASREAQLTAPPANGGQTTQPIGYAPATELQPTPLEPSKQYEYQPRKLSWSQSMATLGDTPICGRSSDSEPRW